MEKFINKIGSRKFIGFLIGTLLCVFGKISGETWFAVFAVYCGANVAQKIGLTLTSESKSEKDDSGN